MARLINATFAQHIANVELSHDDAGIVQWVLSHTPTAEAAEVVHGKWLDVFTGFNFFAATCSVCHKRSDLPPIAVAKYCPRCGARMDGDYE